MKKTYTVRSTYSLPKDLFNTVKSEAQEQGISQSEVVSWLLTLGLAAQEQKLAKTKKSKQSFLQKWHVSGARLKPGVDINDNQLIYGSMMPPSV